MPDKKRRMFTQHVISFFSMIILAGLPAASMRAEAATVMMAEIPGVRYLITTEEVTARVAPDQSAASFAILQPGIILTSTAMTADGWYHITFCGINGYINGENIAPYAGGSEQTPLPELDLTGSEFTMNALGDSITYGEKVSSQDKVYVNLLGTMLGAEKVYNYGLSGSAIAGNHPLRFVDRFRAMDPNADLILVFGGTNDFGFHTPLGQMGDLTADTFYGGLNLMMCEMMQRYPDSEIVFLTPLRRLRDTRPNKTGSVLGDYAQAIREMSAFYDIPVIDLYSSQEVYFLADRYRYIKDGIHPNDAGQSVLAHFIYQNLVIQ